MAKRYLNWYKNTRHHTYAIGASGILPCKTAELPFIKWNLEINGNYGYGYAPLSEAIAKRYQVSPKNIVTTVGTSMANFIVMASLLKADDEVLLEHPVYDPILQILEYLNVNIKRLHRNFENKFQIDLNELQDKITDKTKMIILTNLHNPSGALLTNDFLKQIAEVAAPYDCKILVDEVYLDLMFEDKQETAFKLGDQFIVTSSLTKTYGLGNLRCGWIFAEPKLVERFWEFNDLTEGCQVFLSEQVAVQMFEHIDFLAKRARSLLTLNRKLLTDFFKNHPELEVITSPYATTYFPRWAKGDVDKLVEQLQNEYQTSVIPGRFFEMPDYFRIGIGGEPDIFAEGLKRLGQCLAEHMRTFAK